MVSSLEEEDGDDPDDEELCLRCFLWCLRASGEEDEDVEEFRRRWYLLAVECLCLGVCECPCFALDVCEALVLEAGEWRCFLYLWCLLLGLWGSRVAVPSTGGWSELSESALAVLRNYRSNHPACGTDRRLSQSYRGRDRCLARSCRGRSRGYGPGRDRRRGHCRLLWDTGPVACPA